MFKGGFQDMKRVAVGAYIRLYQTYIFSASLSLRFAMLEVGIIQPKNAKSILFKNMLDMFVVALCWFMWGFGIAGKGASGAASDGGEVQVCIA